MSVVGETHLSRLEHCRGHERERERERGMRREGVI